jgi:ABC-type transport system substrate-binding protein
MQDKKLVLTTILVALMMLSMTVAPSLAFVYPDGSQDDTFEIYGPHIDKILVKKYLGLDAEMLALQSGEIDFTDWALTKTWVDTFAVDPDVRVLGYGGEVGYYTFNFNHNNNPYLGNPEDPAYPNPRYPCPTAVVSLRQAFSHLIDRVALSAGPGEGLYDPIFTPIPAYMVYWIHPDIKYGGDLETIAYPPSVSDAAAKLTADGFLMGGPGGKRYWDRNQNAAYDGASEDLNIIMYSRADKLRKGAADALCAGLNDPTIQVAYTRFEVTGGQAWQKCMVEKDYHMYTAGWIYIGPDPDYLYDLYHWDNYYHPEDPPNWGAISKHDTAMQTYLWNIKVATNVADALTNTLLFQEQFAATASEIPLASTSAPKAYSKDYTGGNDGVAKDPDDGENKYRSLPWTNVLNEKGQGEGSWFTTLNAYPQDPNNATDFGDGNMVARWGWKEIDMPKTLNPMYSSWYWESDIYGRIYDSMGGRDPMTKGPVEVPYLADNWTIGTWVDPRDSLTKATVTVSMRPDALWSDGIPMTVDDVIYTFIDMPAALRAKGCPDVWWQPTLDQIAGFYKLDEYTVQVLMKVNAVWAVNWIVGNIVVPKHLWEPYIADHTVPEISGDFSGRDTYMLTGTGPFLYVENTPNTVLMIRNPTYYQFWDKCINMYKNQVVKGIQVTALPPSTQLSPYKIKEDGTGIGHLVISVPVQNMDERHWEDFNKTVHLIYPNGDVVYLGGVTHYWIAPSAFYWEYFTQHLPKGKYTINVTLTIASGHNYEYWKNKPNAEHFIGPKSFYKNFSITVKGDLNGDGKVNIQDIVYVALGFGSIIGGAGYNPAADLNHDGKVNIVDIVLVALDFGWAV